MQHQGSAGKGRAAFLSRGDHVVSMPHMGDYWVPIKTLGELLDCTVMMPPPMTRRTLELGTKHSPEFVCLPFKYNLGNYLEALDKGATLLVQAGGGCRFGYYGEVQEAILRDLGYDFDFLRLSGNTNLREFYRDFKLVNPKLTWPKALSAFRMAIAQTRALDETDRLIRARVGFQREPGAMEGVKKRFIRKLDELRDVKAVRALHRETMRELEAVPVDMPEDRLRVGVVGELYVLMEPFSNYFVEQQLAKRGCEVHRFVTVSQMFDHSGRKRHNKHIRHMLDYAAPYLKYHVGADGTESVGMTHKLMKDGFDGVLHIKPFGCMPEVNAMSALQRLSRENLFPVLFISYDSQWSETGLQTRLDAFCDMLTMRKKRASA